MHGRRLLRVENPFPQTPSAASHGNRAVLYRDSLYYAFGRSLFTVSVDPAIVSEATHLNDSRWDQVLTLSNGSYHAAVAHSNVHTGSIQSLNILDGTVFSCADSGEVVSFNLEASESEGPGPVVRVHADEKVGHRGWCGVAIHPSSTNEIAVARYYEKTVRLYDHETLVKEFSTISQPTSIQYINAFSSTPSLFLTEGGQCSIWDIRTRENGGCTKRLQPTQSSLYSSAHSGNIIGVVGSDRVVHVYDMRKWTIAGRWSGCLKYAANNIQFSKSDPSICFVSGYDHEVSCGRWDGSNKQFKPFSIRADSRWLGVHADGDRIAGFCDSGAVYFIPNMSMPTAKSLRLEGAADDEKEAGKRPRLGPHQ